jgi:hypothetical protein
MKIFESIKNIFDSNHSIERLDNSFIFPYSADKEIRHKQIWNNLQKGLLFENTQVLIPWLIPYFELDNYAEQRENSGDRINWFLGQHKILTD